MNNVHDMGGVQAFGPVPTPDPQEPVFKAPWEARVFAMQMATMMLGIWRPGVIRASVEALPPGVYLDASYYERWGLGLERRLVGSHLVDVDEIVAGQSLRGGRILKGWRRLSATVRGAFAVRLGTSVGRRANSSPAFEIGRSVRTKNINPPTHTRLPRYARNHIGIVEHVRGVQSLPDVHVLGDQERLEWVYSVAFESRELWGLAADPNAKISIDAWESYLEAA